MVAALLLVVRVAVIGGLIVLGVMTVAGWFMWREREYQAAVGRRLQAFEQAQRIREAAAAQRSTYEINMRAHHAYQAMLREAMEASCRASSTAQE